MYIRSVPKEIKEMLESIAEETGEDYRFVEDVYFHQFDFVAREIQSATKGEVSTYKNILIKHLGSFIVNEKYLNKLNEIFKDKTQ